MAIEIRPAATRPSSGRRSDSIGQYFGGWPDEAAAERFRGLLPLERMHAALATADTIVGGAGAFPFTMTVPGGEFGCGGVTVVGVLPTHRRRGVLSALMREQLDDVHGRGEPIAALWASEEPIYGRFGYGLASYAGEVRSRGRTPASRRHRAARARCGWSSRRGARALPAGVGSASAARRPGMFLALARLVGAPCAARSARPARRRRAEGFALLELDGRDAGYAIYRHRMDWEDGSSNGSVEIVEAMADSAEATRELWRFLLDIDWVATDHGVPGCRPTIRSSCCSREPRRMRFRLGDGLWVRLVDVGAALAGTDLRGGRRGRRSSVPTRSARGTRAVGGSPAAARANGRRSRSRARRRDARLRLPRRLPLRAARAGRPSRGAQAGRGRARGRHLPPRPAAVVPGDLLSLG